MLEALSLGIEGKRAAVEELRLQAAKEAFGSPPVAQKGLTRAPHLLQLPTAMQSRCAAAMS